MNPNTTKYNVGLIVVATNKYDSFLYNLFDGADKFFLKNHNVTYFVFTDSDIDLSKYQAVKVPYEHRKWPYVTLERYEGFWNNREVFKDQDYLFLCDADMAIVDEVGDELLSDNVATIHPGIYGGRGNYETNPESLAYISEEEPIVYFCGGFCGGSKETFLNKSQTISTNINKDKEKNLIAIWYDESHSNRWYLDYPPTKILDCGYCYQESLQRPHKPRIIALDKNHKEFGNYGVEHDPSLEEKWNA